MAIARYEWYAPSLQMEVPVTVFDPSDKEGTVLAKGGGGEGQANPKRLLFLLHGMSGNCTVWTRNSRLTQYVKGRNIVVVMPELGRSYGANEIGGMRYWDYLRYDMPKFVSELLRLDVPAERCGVAGLSMGGYASMRWALAAPDQFAVCGAFSGTLNVAARWQELERGEHRRVFGPDVPLEGTEVDLLAQVGLVDSAVLPSLYVSCGEQDPLFQHNLDFVAAARAAHGEAAVHTFYGPGAHDWDFWDAQLLAFLNWWDQLRD